MNADNYGFLVSENLKNNLLDVLDPGNAGTVEIENRGFAILKLTTAGAESRVLESAAHLGVGQTLLVCAVDLGGNATIDSDAPDVVLVAEGDWVLYQVVPASTDFADNIWVVVASNVAQANVADTSAVAAVPATPTAQDAVDALLALSVALANAGVISDALTQTP